MSCLRLNSSFTLLVIGALFACPVAAERDLGYLFPDSAQRQITAESLLDLNSEQLWQARNEIYARRGYVFASSRGKALAASLSRSPSAIGGGELNAIERANLDLIARFEGYLREEPHREFESSYVVRSKSPINVRNCVGSDCTLIGQLRRNCHIQGDWRMDHDDWIYVRSSTCNGVAGPACGYVPKHLVKLLAG